MIPGSDFLSDQNSGRTGKSGEEADDQALQGAQYRGGSDCLIHLVPQNNIDHHIPYANQQFVGKDRKAFAQVF